MLTKLCWTIPCIHLLLSAVSAQTPCSLCQQDGAEIAFPDKIVQLPGYPDSSCQSLEALIPALLTDSASEECKLIQSLESLCGCPERQEPGCSICPDGSLVQSPQRELPSLLFDSYFFGQNINCEVLEAYINSTDPSEAICLFSQDYVSRYCGCGGAIVEDDTSPESAPCHLCLTDNPDETLSELDISCSDIQQAAPMLLPNTTAVTCSILQEHERMAPCGSCAAPTNCLLCSDLDFVLLGEVELPWLELQFGFIPTCQDMVNHIETVDGNSGTCQDAQWWGPACGCRVEGKCDYCDIPEEMHAKKLSNTLQSRVEEQQKDVSYKIEYTCGALQSMIRSEQTAWNSAICKQAFKKDGECVTCGPGKCNICAHMGSVSLPAKSVPFLDDQFGYTPTCAEVADFASGFDRLSGDCKRAMWVGPHCGCSNLGSCDLSCQPDGSGIPEEFLGKDLGQDARELLQSIFPSPNLKYSATCALAESAVASYDVGRGSPLCGTINNMKHQCGCVEAKEKVYYFLFGSESIAQDEALIWVTRGAAILSLLGTCLILQDVLLSKTRRQNLYNQIVFAMTCFDFIFALACCFSRAPMPIEDFSLLIYGSSGNEATCKAQGFFLQLGMTSLFYNVSLSIYFLLVVVRNYRETQLKRVRPWVLGVPLVAGISIAFASIPFIWGVGYACHLSPPVEQRPNSPGNWGPFLGLFLMPGWLSILIVTCAMLCVCWHVRSINKNSRRWQFGREQSTSSQQSPQNSQPTERRSVSRMISASMRRLKSNSRRSSTDDLQKEVFWQALLYLISMYMAWTLLLVMSASGPSIYLGPYYLWMVALCLIPLQGFMNSLVYFRPRMVRAWKKWKKSREERITSMASAKLESDLRVISAQSSLHQVAEFASVDDSAS